MRPSLFPIINNTPPWVLRADGVRPTIYADFSNGRYWANRRPMSDFETWRAALSGTFTRASTAYRTNISGLLESVATNTLRFDYDPVTFAPKGILLEGARTNVILQSGDPANASWLKQDASVPGTTATGPDGNQSLYKVVPATTASVQYHAIYQGFTATAAPWSHQVVAADAGYDWIFLWNGLAGAGARGVYFNVNTGVKGTEVGGATGTIKSLANGTFLCTVTWTGTVATQYLELDVVQSDNSIATPWTANGTDGVYVGFLGTELGSFASSYTPTTTTSVTRAADSVTRTRTSPAIVTKKFKAIAPIGIGTSSPQTLWQIDDGSANNRIRVYRDVTAKHVFVNVTSGGVDQAALDMGVVADSTEFSLAFRAQANDFAASLDGGAVVTDVSGTMPAGMTTERWAADSAGDQWFGHCEVDVEWTELAASNSALQALAA